MRVVQCCCIFTVVLNGVNWLFHVDIKKNRTEKKSLTLHACARKYIITCLKSMRVILAIHICERARACTLICDTMFVSGPQNAWLGD